MGRFCWYELLAEDPEGAPECHRQIAGWSTEVWEPEGGHPYTMWKTGDASMGGVMRLPDEAVQGGAPSHWLVHISGAT